MPARPNLEHLRIRPPPQRATPGRGRCGRHPVGEFEALPAPHFAVSRRRQLSETAV